MASHLLAPRHISSSTLSRPAGADETASNRLVSTVLCSRPDGLDQDCSNGFTRQARTALATQRHAGSHAALLAMACPQAISAEIRSDFQLARSSACEQLATRYVRGLRQHPDCYA